mgnify:CR=1 FL=1
MYLRGSRAGRFVRTDGGELDRAEYLDLARPSENVAPHRYGAVEPLARIEYTLLWGEDGPKHADATATFEDQGGATKVTLSMVMVSAEEATNARNFGAVELGQQTLGKLEAAVLHA